MTTITIDRATVQQALEELEADCGGRCNAEYNPCWQREVAETLRAALAQQAEQKENPWRCACGANLYIDENGAPRSKA